MDIAALSMGLSQMKIAQQVSISAMKMAMDVAEVQAANLVKVLETNAKMMELSVQPHLGANLDITL
ncbi:MAG TPA: putative motility protein [Clostridiales bacterium]|nr:putative motility protein [Clostridiales bacterium]